jgi:hypothetical protein
MIKALSSDLLCVLYEYETENYCQRTKLQVTKMESMNGTD